MKIAALLGMSAVLLACAGGQGQTTHTQAGGTQTTQSGASGHAAAGEACGTRGARPCEPNLFCNYPVAASCGQTDHGGVCAARPKVCPDHVAQVCGCDGATYDNECRAAEHGASVAKNGPCK